MMADIVERLRYAATSRPGGICEEAANEIERLRAAPPAAPAPGNMVMVPREPTDAMKVAAWKEQDSAGEWAHRMWRAMIAAAPAQPAVPLTDGEIISIYSKTLKQSLREQDTSIVLQFARAVLSAAPAVREPQDERIRCRDSVIKEAESALRVAEQEFSEMLVWANMGHAAKKVSHALAVIAALGIGGGGK